MWESVGEVGEMWKSVLRSGGDVGKCGKVEIVRGEMWESVWGECEECG